jgi:hypothetical protein
MPDRQEWPDELDALVAAPEHHALLLENEFVRVLETKVRPGHTVPLHTHQWQSTLHILTWNDFLRRDADGGVVADSRTVATVHPGSALWSGPLPPHTLENVGGSELQAISVELKCQIRYSP